MLIKNQLAIAFLFFIFSSCQSQKTVKNNIDTLQAIQPLPGQEPNYSYSSEVPDNWTIRDTTMQDNLKVRFLLPPLNLKTDYPAVNILIGWMQGQNINDFTTSNIAYLKSNMPGTIILESGNINFSKYHGQWFTYIKEQNGVTRDMINYIIPVNGFAYMITCGSNRGSFSRYRMLFDKIAMPFKE